MIPPELTHLVGDYLKPKKYTLLVHPYYSDTQLLVFDDLNKIIEYIELRTDKLLCWCTAYLSGTEHKLFSVSIAHNGNALNILIIRLIL